MEQGRNIVAIPPDFGLDTIIVTPGLEPVQAPSTIEDPKALSSFSNGTTLVVALKGVQRNEPIGDG